MAWAIGNMPAATAPAAPPLDPPGLRFVSHGLRLGPKRRFSAAVITPNSGVLVRPHSTKPASTSASTTSSVSSLGPSGAPWEPNVTGQPATGVRSLIGIGTPRNGDSSPAAMRRSASPAAARASSSLRQVTSLSSGFSLSTAARQASSSSTEDSSRARSAAASSSAEEAGPRSGMGATLTRRVRGRRLRAVALDLRGKTAFITGAARGIGAATAERMYARGANVALVGLEPERLRANAERLGERAAWFEADVTDMAALEAAVQETVERFGGIDVAVANAGIAFTGTLSTAPVEQVERTLAVNLLGVWRTDRAVLAELRRSRGYLLNVASMAAVMHAPMMGPYTSAKAGVEALTDALRLEVAPHGVGVGCAYFGFLDTDLVKASFAQPSTEAHEAGDARLDAQSGAAGEGDRRDRARRGPPLGAGVVAALGGPPDLHARPLSAARRTPGACATSTRYARTCGSPRPRRRPRRWTRCSASRRRRCPRGAGAGAAALTRRR